MDDLAHHLISSRTWLQRAARLRLRHVEWAEDAVSETLLAALERPPAFDDPTRIRAWLFGVLRHKVVDQLRQHMRDDGAAAEQALAQAEAPAPQADPAQRASGAQFVAALAQALDELPPRQARAFVMSEAWGSSTAEISHELGITHGHVWVLLHRARVRLRRGLQAHVG